MRQKTFFPLTIRNYALIFLFIVFVFFSAIGLYAYSSIEQARSNIHANNYLAAKEELRQSVTYLTASISALSNQVSYWDEVFQQLENPAYYSYWRKYRLLTADVLPDYIESAEVFDHNGHALAAMSDSLFPASIDVHSLRPFLEVKGDAISYWEEYSCLGIKHSYTAGKDTTEPYPIYNCYGMKFGKKCYSVDSISPIEKSLIDCE